MLMYDSGCPRLVLLSLVAVYAGMMGFVPAINGKEEM